MSPIPSVKSRKVPLARRLLVTLMLAAAASLYAALPAAAMTRAELYQASVPAPARGEANQAAAFAQAMRIVLVRITGRRNAGDDAAMSPLVGEARRYVQQFRAAADNQLSVAFDSNAIDRWLAQNGQPIWGRDRPTTFVWLVAPAAGNQPATVVRAEDSPDIRTAVEAEAQLRGIALRWPAAADLIGHHIEAATLLTGPNPPLFELGRQLGGEGVLIGRPGPAGSILWAHQFHDHAGSTAGLTEGIDALADLYAGLFAASGAPAPVDLEVSGLGDVAAYARVQGTLESLAFVTHVSVRGLDADRMQLRLSVRGGAVALQRALALNGFLEPLASSDPAVLRYQLRP